MIFITITFAYASFFLGSQKGWHWYEQQEEEQEEKKDEDEKKTPSIMIETYKKELQNKLSKAWIHPTEDNIKAYQLMQKDMMDRSKIFSDVWMKTVFLNPNLDHTLTSPVNQQARHIHLDLEKEKIKKTIEGLSNEYGLFFFFSGSCKYCHSFAPIVKNFSQEYSWEVLAICVDEGSLKEFPNAIQDNGLSQKWDVQTLPALFAVNPHTQHVIPLAYGMTSLDQIETRLIKILERSK